MFRACLMEGNNSPTFHQLFGSDHPSSPMFTQLHSQFSPSKSLAASSWWCSLPPICQATWHYRIIIGFMISRKSFWDVPNPKIFELPLYPVIVHPLIKTCLLCEGCFVSFETTTTGWTLQNPSNKLNKKHGPRPKGQRDSGNCAWGP